MESTTTTMTRQQRPVPLPEGWREWIRDAVYFAASSCSYKGTVSGGEAISIYAINTKDDRFPVYHVIDFLCEPETCKASEAAFAILGVRVYVVAGESTWYCDMRTGLWEKGLDLNGIMRKPMLFTLRSYYLYVLDSLLVPEPSSGYSFQVRVEPGWYSLEDPPSLFPANADFQSDCVICGLSCIDNYKVILHVSSAQQGPSDVSLKQHFLCFCLTDECEGEWCTLELKLPESCVPRASHFPDGLYPFYRSHLNDGEPLILPSLPGKLHALYLLISPESESEIGESEMRLEYDQEVYISDHDIDCEWRNKTMRTWNLFHVAGNKYCAVAFPHPEPNDYRDSFRGGFFIFSFNLAVPPREVEEMEVDGYNASASFSKLTIEHVHQWFGAQCPLP